MSTHTTWQISLWIGFICPAWSNAPGWWCSERSVCLCVCRGVCAWAYVCVCVGSRWYCNTCSLVSLTSGGVGAQTHALRHMHGRVSGAELLAGKKKRSPIWDFHASLCNLFLSVMYPNISWWYNSTICGFNTISNNWGCNDTFTK